MKQVDLNVDIGEGFPFDAKLLEFVTSASVCCGEHAGTWELTRKTVELCKTKGVRIGAHPGFPDRDGMGRRMPTPTESARWLMNAHEQTLRFANAFQPNYVKPHGAWYNLLNSPQDANDARLYWMAMNRVKMLANAVRLPFMFLHTSRPAIGLGLPGIKIIKEGFADRRYLPDGTLVPRTQPGAVLHDLLEIQEQVLRLAPAVDSICLHGDTKDCLKFAELVRRTLIDAGYGVCA